MGTEDDWDILQRWISRLRVVQRLRIWISGMNVVLGAAIQRHVKRCGIMNRSLLLGGLLTFEA